MRDGKLEAKYQMEYKNGKPINPDHRFFVLSIDTDSYARKAACYYADLCRESHPILSQDMIQAYGLNCEGEDRP